MWWLDKDEVGWFDNIVLWVFYNQLITVTEADANAHIMRWSASKKSKENYHETEKFTGICNECSVFYMGIMTAVADDFYMQRT